MHVKLSAGNRNVLDLTRKKCSCQVILYSGIDTTCPNDFLGPSYHTSEDIKQKILVAANVYNLNKSPNLKSLACKIKIASIYTFVQLMDLGPCLSRSIYQSIYKNFKHKQRNLLLFKSG